MRIGEMAKEADISEYTLRYYEKKELIRVKRDHAGRRCYEESDIEWIKFILAKQRAKRRPKRSVDAAKRYQGIFQTSV